jgi:hypothetical protein
METMTGTETERPSAASTPHRRWVLPLVALLALCVGALGGWWLARWSETEPTVVRAGGGEFSAREQQALDVVRRYQAAWLANDSAAVAASYAPGGVFVWEGESFRPDDGSLEAFVGRFDWSGIMTVLDPQLVSDQMFVYRHDILGFPYADVIEVTAEGEPLIVRHVEISTVLNPYPVTLGIETLTDPHSSQ